MNPDERIEAMIRSCVDHEVREVVIPDGLAERVVRNAGEKRRPRRFSFVVGMTALATATAVAVAPVSSRLLFDTAPAPDGEAALAPRPLEGRVDVAVLPPGASRFDRMDGPHRREEGRFLWTDVYRLNGEQRGYVWIQVISGNIDLREAVIRFSSPTDLSGLETASVSRGEARVWGRDGLQNVVFQPEPGLVVVVRTMNVRREQAVRIAEGVSVR